LVGSSFTLSRSFYRLLKTIKYFQQAIDCAGSICSGIVDWYCALVVEGLGLGNSTEI
jgi:hypothetical protein